MKILCLVLSISLIINDLYSVIVPAPDIREFERELEKADLNTLVLFDVDQTLLVTKDPCFKGNWNLWHKHKSATVENPQIAKYPPEYLVSKMWQAQEMVVVDPKMRDLISQLQQRGIKTIAFTNMPIGPLGVIEALEDFRIEELKTLHIDFSSTFPCLEWNKPKRTLFKSGILFGNMQSKGEVLVAFLKKIGWQPTKVILIDDKLEYLETVDTSLKSKGMDFVGFHYTVIEDTKYEVDENLLLLRMTHLAQTGEWLSEEVWEGGKPDSVLYK